MFVTGASSADLEVRQVQVFPKGEPSRVPAVSAQRHTLAPQAVSAVDITADGKFITVATMAFRHDANVWQFAPDGMVLSKRHYPPWAPMQVATLSGGGAMAVGLAYSRVTAPEPTVWMGATGDLLQTPLRNEFAEADTRDSELARLRPGAGDWRTGWLASQLGELFVRGPDWAFKPPGLMLHADGRRESLRAEDKNLLPTSRATRMAASRDGKRAAFGWLSLNQASNGVLGQREAVSVWGVNPNRPLWTAPSSEDLTAPALPNPAASFPELVKDGFRLAADAVEPGTVAAALAVNADGSRVALVEYAVHVWVRKGPAIGKWDPPIHALNFVPKQRGQLRVFDGEGKELLRKRLPEVGLFDVGFGGDADIVWCWPSSWFARGMAGAPWLPVERDALNVYRVSIAASTAVAIGFPDAIADCAPSPADGRALVACWDGRTSLVDDAGVVSAKWDLNSPARLTWSADGAFAIAGTADGNLLRVERDGKLGWKQTIPVAEQPVVTTPPDEVFAGIPVYQGGRFPQSEDAYVGDIWILKLGREAVLVDAGGTSNCSISQAREG